MKETKMILNIQDLLRMRSILPIKGDMIEQRIVRSITEKIEISQEEIKEIGLKQEGPNLRWDPTKVKDREVIFTELELDIMKKGVEDLINKKEIDQSNLDICMKIQDLKLEETKKEEASKK